MIKGLNSMESEELFPFVDLGTKGHRGRGAENSGGHEDKHFTQRPIGIWNTQPADMWRQVPLLI